MDSDPITTPGRTRRSIAALTRRSLELVISLCVLILSLPVMVIVAIGSAIVLRSWPFFAQTRVGRNGEHFRFVKIRSLPKSTPAYAAKFQLDMSQVPTFCRVVRKLHLDELPQLVHVVSGRMSLVGPRPEMPHLHQQMDASLAELRTSVPPGCTGLWQISAACVELIHESPEYDRFYVSHRSLRLDLWILYRTLLKMSGLSRRSLDLDSLPEWVAPDGAVSPQLSETITAPATAAR